MPFTASVTSAGPDGEEYQVTLEFTDGVTVITGTFRNANPSATWIPDLVRDRIAALENVHSYNVPIGAVTPSDPPVDLSGLIEYRKKCKMVPVVQGMVALDAVPITHPKVVNFVDEITADSGTYFEDLYS